MNLDDFAHLIAHHVAQHPNVEVRVDFGHFEAVVTGVALRGKPYPAVNSSVPDRLVIKVGISRGPDGVGQGAVTIYDQDAI